MPSASYIDPSNGELYPLDVPRWRSDGGGPLMVTPLTGIGRDEIERGTRSLWRYRAALPVGIVAPISLGEGCDAARRARLGRFAAAFQARMV